MRSKLAWLILPTFGLALAGCPDDGDDSGTSNATTGDTDPSTSSDPSTSNTTSASTTMSTSDSTTMTTDPTTTMTTDATESSSTDPTDPDSSGTESGSGSESGSESTGGGACPPEKTDDACVECTKLNCCEELTPCSANPDCDCFSMCIAEMGPFMDAACQKACDLTENPDEWEALFTCVAGSCIADCA